MGSTQGYKQPKQILEHSGRPSEGGTELTDDERNRASTIGESAIHGLFRRTEISGNFYRSTKLTSEDSWKVYPLQN